MKGEISVSYAKWETRENMFQRVIQINENSVIEKGGIPIMYDENNLYLNNDEAHSLIIGTTGSGKTQSTILPLMKLSMSETSARKVCQDRKSRGAFFSLI